MQKLIRCLMVCCAFFGGHAGLWAQPANVTRVEYYIDADPGYGKAAAVAITPGTNLQNVSLNINPASLGYGVHLLGLRALNANGKWGIDNKWLFARPYPADTTTAKITNITRVEYYIDGDPGFGKATNITIVPGTSLSNILLKINPANVATGVHVLGVRAQNANGAWGYDNKWLFARPYAADTTKAPPVTNITRVEYYLDSDPGYGNGKALSFTPGTSLANVNINIPVDSTLAHGAHILGVRAQNANGAWGYDNKWLFARPYAADTTTYTIPGLQKLEYYIDNDPGYGNGVPVVLDSGKNLQNVKIALDVSGLKALTNHTLFMRALNANGNWSFVYEYTFEMKVPAASPAITINRLLHKAAYCARDTVAFSYDAIGTFKPGNQFTLQLSDNTGSFNTPITVGTFTATDDSIVRMALPAHLTSGTKYRLRLVSSSPAATGLTGLDTLTIHDAPQLTNPSKYIACSGTATNIAITADSTAGANTFSWSVGATGGVTGGTSGTGALISQVLYNPGNSTADTLVYNVVATSAIGCASSITPDTVIVSAKPVAGASTTNTTLCSGASTAINLSATTPGASSFSWVVSKATGGVTGASASTGNLLAQTLVNPGTTADTVIYTINVSSAAGCAAPVITDTVVVNATPVVKAGASKLQICSNTQPGIGLSANTPGNNTFVWFATHASGGATGASGGGGALINQTLANPSNNVTDTVIYNITATSAQACPSAPVYDTVLVNATPAVTGLASSAITSGNKTSITPTVTTAGAGSFSWTIYKNIGGVQGASSGNGASITQKLTNLGHTFNDTLVYSITGTSAAGCVSAPAKDTVVVIPLACSPDSSTTTLNICATALPYVWNGSTFNAAGTYTVHLTNAGGCDSAATLVLSVFTASFTPVQSTEACYGKFVYAVARGMGGTAPYSFSLNGGAPVQLPSYHIYNLVPGTYTETVKDAAGCTVTTSALTVVQPAAKLTVSLADSAFNCAGTSASITATAAGSYGGYMYSLDGGTPQASNVFTVSGAGTHTVTVADSVGCSISQSITAGPLAATFAATGKTAVCYGAEVNATVTAKSGVAPYMYSLNGGSYQTAKTWPLAAGTYSVTVKDAKGCTITTDAVTVTQPAEALTVIATPTNVTCKGASDGSITATGSGGYGSYLYSFNGGGFGPANTFTGLKAAGYYVKVKDENGCLSANEKVVITQPAKACADADPSEKVVPELQLKLKAYPNPSQAEFTLVVESGDSRSKVGLIVRDMYGKALYSTTGTIYDTYRFGSSFAGGMYIAEVVNGSQHATIKLVKGN